MAVSSWLVGLALLAGACGAAGTPELEVSAAQAAVPLAGSSQIVLTITNHGDGDDALVAVDTDAAVGIELHETRIADDRATMVSLEEVELPAGETVRFRPGGLHLMMIAPDDEVVLGATFELTLEFDRSEAITTTAEVRDLLDLAEDALDDPDA
ncbi:MAG: copper chaperone PCu(A)C [Nitriliruptor sp.]|nr:MAG: copper chaperone PCu(A)C [Nitriliruptor sp.]